MLAILLTLLIMLFSYTSIGVGTYAEVVRDDGCTVNPCP